MPTPVAAAAATPANTAIPAPTQQAAAPAQAQTPATQNGDAPAQSAAKFRVKVNGEFKEYSQAEAEKLLSKAGYADLTIRQAKEELKRIAAEREKYKLDESIFSDESKLEEWIASRNPEVLDKLARKRLAAKVAEQEMTPEQREAAAAKAEAERLKKELADRDNQTKAQKAAEVQKVLQQRMEAQLLDAAVRGGLMEAGKSIDGESFYAVFAAVKEAKELGLPWNPDQIIETAKENIDGGFKRLEQSVLKGLKGKALVDRLGDAVVKEVLRFKAEEYRNGGARPVTPTQPAQQKKAEPEFMSPQEYEARRRGLR